jgi:hypothetical protein
VKLLGNGVLLKEMLSGYHDKIAPLLQHHNLSQDHYHSVKNKRKPKASINDVWIGYFNLHKLLIH